MNRGFTLGEMMAVLVIIGILTTLGGGVFFDLIAKARRAEAFTMLAHLDTQQKAYRLENGTYWVGETGESLRRTQKYDRNACDQKNGLHFYSSNCKDLRFRYWVVSTGNSKYDPEQGYAAVAWANNTGNHVIYPTCNPTIAGSAPTIVVGAKGGGTTSFKLVKLNSDGSDQLDGSGSSIPRDMAGDMFLVTDKASPTHVIDVEEQCD